MINDPEQLEQLDQLCITTIRTLSIDAVQKAQSGHPGTPMGMAPTAYCLAIIGMRSFGVSAPGKVVEARFGFDAAHVVAAAKEQLARHVSIA